MTFEDWLYTPMLRINNRAYARIDKLYECVEKKDAESLRTMLQDAFNYSAPRLTPFNPSFPIYGQD
jgi:hypothetical protein